MSLLALPLLPLDTSIYACMLIYLLPLCPGLFNDTCAGGLFNDTCAGGWADGKSITFYHFVLVIVKQAVHGKGLSNHVKPTPALVFETLPLETAGMKNWDEVIVYSWGHSPNRPSALYRKWALHVSLNGTQSIQGGCVWRLI